MQHSGPLWSQQVEDALADTGGWQAPASLADWRFSQLPEMVWVIINPESGEMDSETLHSRNSACLFVFRLSFEWLGDLERGLHFKISVFLWVLNTRSNSRPSIIAFCSRAQQWRKMRRERKQKLALFQGRQDLASARTIKMKYYQVRGWAKSRPIMQTAKSGSLLTGALQSHRLC